MEPICKKFSVLYSTKLLLFTHAMGDFNANVLSDTHRFGNELINYCDSERLVISDKELAPTNTFTFLSETHSTVSWIDHIVSTVNMHGIISQVIVIVIIINQIYQIWVDNTYISSDHFPNIPSLGR